MYRRMRIGAAQRELSRDQDARLLSPGCRLVTHQGWTRVALAAPSFPLAPTSGTRPAIITGGLARSPLTPQRPPTTYVVLFLDDLGPVQLKLSSSRYATAAGAEHDS